MNRADLIKSNSSFSLGLWTISTSISNLKICWNNYRILEVNGNQIIVPQISFSTFAGSFLPPYNVTGQIKIGGNWTIQTISYNINTLNGTLIGKEGLLFLYLQTPVAALNNNGVLLLPQGSKIMTKISPQPMLSILNVDLGNDYYISLGKGIDNPISIYYKDQSVFLLGFNESTTFSTYLSPLSKLSSNTCIIPSGVQKSDNWWTWLIIVVIVVGFVGCFIFALIENHKRYK